MLHKPSLLHRSRSNAQIFSNVLTSLDEISTTNKKPTNDLEIDELERQEQLKQLYLEQTPMWSEGESPIKFGSKPIMGQNPYQNMMSQNPYGGDNLDLQLEEKIYSTPQKKNKSKQRQWYANSSAERHKKLRDRWYGYQFKEKPTEKEQQGNNPDQSNKEILCQSLNKMDGDLSFQKSEQQLNRLIEHSIHERGVHFFRKSNLVVIQRRNSLLDPKSGQQIPGSIFDINCCDSMKEKKPPNIKMKILGREVEIEDSEGEEKNEIYQVIRQTDPKQSKNEEGSDAVVKPKKVKKDQNSLQEKADVYARSKAEISNKVSRLIQEKIRVMKLSKSDFKSPKKTLVEEQQNEENLYGNATFRKRNTNASFNRSQTDLFESKASMNTRRSRTLATYSREDCGEQQLNIQIQYQDTEQVGIEQSPYKNNTATIKTYGQATYKQNNFRIRRNSQSMLSQSRLSVINDSKQKMDTIKSNQPPPAILQQKAIAAGVCNIQKRKPVFDSVFDESELKILYEAKCKDTGVPYSEQPYQRFLAYCKVNAVNRKLNFKNQNISGNFIKELAKQVAIKDNIAEMCIADNNLRDGVLGDLCNAIRESKSLVFLDVQQNNFTTAGVNEICQSLLDNESIISINLGNAEIKNPNKFSEKPIKTLKRVIQNSQILTNLSLDCILLDDSLMKLLIPGIEKSQSLLKLSLKDSCLTHKSVYRLKKIIDKTNLQDLNLKGNPIGNTGATLMHEILKLEHNQISILDISNCKLTTDGYMEIMSSFRFLHCKLESLTMNDNNFENITNTQGVQVNKNLEQTKSLQSLSLANCQLRSQHVVSIALAIKFNNILNLNLSGNFLDDQICQNFADNLNDVNKDAELAANGSSQKRPKLQSLNLSRNGIGQCTCKEGVKNCSHVQGVIALAEGLGNNTSLNYLNLYGNELNSSCGQAFLSTLRTNQTLTKINLNCNFVPQLIIDEIDIKLNQNAVNQHHHLMPQTMAIKEKLKFCNKEMKKHNKIDARNNNKQETQSKQDFKQALGARACMQVTETKLTELCEQEDKQTDSMYFKISKESCKAEDQFKVMKKDKEQQEEMLKKQIEFTQKQQIAFEREIEALHARKEKIIQAKKIELNAQFEKINQNMNRAKKECEKLQKEVQQQKAKK